MSERVRIQRSFFFQFSNGSFFRRFPSFDTSTRKSQPAFPWFLAAFDQQEAAITATYERNTVYLNGGRDDGNCNHAQAMMRQTAFGNSKARLTINSKI
jgi:hypothetical protein